MKIRFIFFDLNKHYKQSGVLFVTDTLCDLITLLIEKKFVSATRRRLADTLF